MQNLTKELVENFTKEARYIEKRKLATHIDITTGESIWEMISRPDIMHVTTKEICLLAFKHGGFIAGGLARWALTSSMTAKERFSYVRNGGDIDLFFNTKQGWIDFLDELCNTEFIKYANLSPGKLAVDLKSGDINLSKMPTIQAIGCVFGTPQQVLSSFDFVNCMAAFDDKNLYYASNLLQLEKDKILGIVSWQSHSTLSRIKKYVRKYGYQSGVDMCENRVEQLCDEISKRPERFAQYYTQKWVEFLNDQNYSNFLEQSLRNDLIVCAVLPHDDNTNNFSLLLNKQFDVLKTEILCGSYQYTIDHLSRREQDIILLDDEVVQSTFNSEEYCWTF